MLKVMIAAFVLIAGVLLIMLIGAVVLSYMGASPVLTAVAPMAPGLVMVGTLMLILTELLLFLGGKEDRRTAARDLPCMVLVLIVSGALWYVSQQLLW